MCACKNFVKLLNSFLLLILQKKTVFLQSISKIIKMKKVIVTLICGGHYLYALLFHEPSLTICHIA